MSRQGAKRFWSSTEFRFFCNPEDAGFAAEGTLQSRFISASAAFQHLAARGISRFARDFKKKFLRTFVSSLACEKSAPWFPAVELLPGHQDARPLPSSYCGSFLRRSFSSGC